MNTPARLSLYGAGLVAVFGLALGVTHLVVPDSAVAERAAATDDAHGAHAGADAGDETAEAAGEAALPGLSMSADGYTLSEVAAPTDTGAAGELSFSVLGEDGEPLTAYTEEHEKDLHLIVVRSDGSEFRHVHPELDEHGEWSLPWTWDAAGTYRVYTDFTPGDAESGITLTRTVEVAGEVAPVTASEDVREFSVDGYTATLHGDLAAGGSSSLSVEIAQDGEPVTELEPYLGAFGHLVALREGDLAYLHVHPEGAAPEPGELSGPAVEFATEAPTEGRYLLYFDFQIAGEVHTAEFVLNTAGTAAGDGEHDDAH